MSRTSRVYPFVVAVAGAAALAMAFLYDSRLPFPGWWPLATFVFVATLLDSLNTQLRLGAIGSTSFIMHMSAALLFGGWWGALIAGVSTCLGEIFLEKPVVKVLFNVSQRTLAVCLASMAYSVLGGQLPPSYLVGGASLATEIVQRDLGVFFVFASVYFLVNTSAVNTAIVLSSGRAFREVWNLNTRGVLVYDIAASAIAVLVVWLYTR